MVCEKKFFCECEKKKRETKKESMKDNFQWSDKDSLREGTNKSLSLTPFEITWLLLAWVNKKFEKDFVPSKHFLP